ncbi:MAG: hypothetical protein COZ88_01350 [Candidatus Nealsonbacteria bacterium CG_4_8_14_3_um_filter_34_13]|nr:MAG: hypothetical protein COZ88_01350 [Candidatus Nealsonbacteria bacterium CG_4_8_14_3_um_filter_34_13]
MKKIPKLLIRGLTFFLFIVPLFALAYQIKIGNPLNASDFKELVNNIITFIFYIATALVPLMVIIGGLIFVTAGGDPQKIQQAKNLILYTAIGFAIILLARGLVAFLTGLL